MKNGVLKAERRRNRIAFLILLVGLFAMLFPFFWMILSAFKTQADVYSYPPKWLPSSWSFDNFARVFKMVPFGRYYFNSILVTTLSTVGQIFVSILAAYSLARLRFPFKNLIFMFIVATMLMPFVVTMIPTFLIISSLKWIDTYQGLIVPFLFNGFSIIFLVQFFITVPMDLQDAARIDGCGYFGILFNVILPSTKPAISTIALFTFLGHWTEYLWPLIIINNTDMRTLPIGLRYLMTEGSSDYQLMMAASVMAIVPVLIVYMFSEKQFIKSITMTGLKS
ncbi:carbohydrate ABC transporter permease [Mesotoga sp. B105.6.4]|uniref:carbohydrate ABC transporter permease n=1 Tax=Mesotoga sp. B105.6.4 TaxID=1582224 RepID=UPI000CCC5DA0|nr:carbohydrate ABC transporter permease [Mesotoga sp. B105.6.4]